MNESNEMMYRKTEIFFNQIKAALNNVPAVGEVYKWEHFKTKFLAVLMINDFLAKVKIDLENLEKKELELNPIKPAKNCGITAGEEKEVPFVKLVDDKGRCVYQNWNGKHLGFNKGINFNLVEIESERIYTQFARLRLATMERKLRVKLQWVFSRMVKTIPVYF